MTYKWCQAHYYLTSYYKQLLGIPQVSVGIVSEFIFTFNYVHVCIYVAVYTCELKLPIGGTGHPGAGVTGGCESLDAGLGTETRASARATQAFHC